MILRKKNHIFPNFKGGACRVRHPYYPLSLLPYLEEEEYKLLLNRGGH